jgi:hypothetical protein
MRDRPLYALGWNAALCIKSDGSLWGWGDYARALALARGEATDGVLLPVRLGKDDDWRSCSQIGSQALIEKSDGSLWLLETPVLNDPGFSLRGYPQLRRVRLPTNVAAFGAGNRTWIVLLRNGEVWTWGEALGERASERPLLKSMAAFLNHLGHWHLYWGEPVTRVYKKPWQLHNIDPDDSKARP